MRVKEEFECNICKYDFSIADIGILASFDNSCSPFTDMFCYCKKCMVQRFENILTEMKIPKVKFKDHKYLKSSLEINYRYHENYNEASLILQALIKSE